MVAEPHHADPTVTPAQIEAAPETTATTVTDGAPSVAGTTRTTSFDHSHGPVDAAATHAIR